MVADNVDLDGTVESLFGVILGNPNVLLEAAPTTVFRHLGRVCGVDYIFVNCEDTRHQSSWMLVTV